MDGRFRQLSFPDGTIIDRRFTRCESCRSGLPNAIETLESLDTPDVADYEGEAKGSGSIVGVQRMSGLRAWFGRK